MALSNSERQKRYKQRRKEKGLIRKEAWTDRDGFTASPREAEDRSRLEYKKFIKALKTMTDPMDETYAEEIYAELLAHAKRLKQRYDQIAVWTDAIVEEEKKKGRWK